MKKFDDIKASMKDAAEKATTAVQSAIDSENTQKLKTRMKDAASSASTAVTTAIEHENTKAAGRWVKEAASDVADHTADLARRAAHSELAKDVATGVAIGVVAGMPIPIVGPVAGGIMGGAGAAFLSIKGGSVAQAPAASKPTEFHQRLTELKDLRDKGALTGDEYEHQKQQVLGPSEPKGEKS